MMTELFALSTYDELLDRAAPYLRRFNPDQERDEKGRFAPGDDDEDAEPVSALAGSGEVIIGATFASAGDGSGDQVHVARVTMEDGTTVVRVGIHAVGDVEVVQATLSEPSARDLADKLYFSSKAVDAGNQQAEALAAGRDDLLQEMEEVKGAGVTAEGYDPSRVDAAALGRVEDALQRTEAQLAEYEDDGVTVSKDRVDSDGKSLKMEATVYYPTEFSTITVTVGRTDLGLSPVSAARLSENIHAMMAGDSQRSRRGLYGAVPRHALLQLPDLGG